MIWGGWFTLSLILYFEEFINTRMPLEETIATFTHFITEADKLGIVYVDLMRYSEMLDPVIDGTYHDTDKYQYLPLPFTDSPLR